MNIKIIFTTVAMTIFTLTNVFAATSKGTSGAAFLKIGVGAKPVSMGEAFVALADSAETIYWNPAGMLNLKRAQAAFAHNEWLQQIKHQYAGIVIPAGNIGVFGISGITIAMDDMDGWNTNDVKADDFTATDLAVGLSWAKYLKKDFGIGLTARFIQQKIEKEQAVGYGGDIGALYFFPDSKTRLGVCLQNIGTELKFLTEGDPQPLNFKIGVAREVIKSILVTSVDLNAPRDNDPRLNVGIEYKILRSLALRAGYKTGADLGAIYGLSAGLGFYVSRMNIDLAFVPYDFLGNNFRVSINYTF